MRFVLSNKIVRLTIKVFRRRELLLRYKMDLWAGDRLVYQLTHHSFSSTEWCRWVAKNAPHQFFNVDRVYVSSNIFHIDVAPIGTRITVPADGIGDGDVTIQRFYVDRYSSNEISDRVFKVLSRFYGTVLSKDEFLELKAVPPNVYEVWKVWRK